MLEARDFVDSCLKREFSFFAAAPCKELLPFTRYVGQNRNLEYVGAANGGEALAIAVGATLAGRLGVALLPNTQLGSLVDPLASLVYPYRIPLLLLVTRYGASGLPGDPQQELMGKVTRDLLARLRVESAPFPKEASQVESALGEALEAMESSGMPFAFLLEEPCVMEVPARDLPRPGRRPPAEGAGDFRRDPSARMARHDAVRVIRDSLTGEEALIAGTGGPGRELLAIGHRSNQFYVPGATGCAAAVALGVARARRRRDVVVIDGDGSALVGLGHFATIGFCAPPRFLHIVLDDEVHGEAAGIASASSQLELPALAAACGYASVWWTDEEQELAELVRGASKHKGPSLIHVKVAPGPSGPPSGLARSPVQIKHQFMDWVQER
jgi:phosphonopyruvate decarboxylase